MENCQLNRKGYCECYLKQCNTIEDCAPKLITKRNMESVDSILGISRKKELKNRK